jgi:acyl-CoA thioesterase-2
MDSANKLMEILSLEKIDKTLYRGHQMQEAGNRVFGGQVLAQAIDAATDTVDSDRHLHSCHGYFILPGDTSLPIVYKVDITRNGGSFSTRRVKAIQNGADIFVLAASFQKTQDGLDHQIEMPKVIMPDELASDYEIAKKFSGLIPDYMQRMMIEKPIEFKPVEIPDFLFPVKSEPVQNIWMKYKGKLPDDPRIHRKILAYASDYNLLITALRPHEITIEQVQLASLDHAMWFHRDFRIDEWLLYALESPSSSNARGFTRGNIFDMNGNLVASVVQEGLLRKKKDKNS